MLQKLREALAYGISPWVVRRCAAAEGARPSCRRRQRMLLDTYARRPQALGIAQAFIAHQIVLGGQNERWCEAEQARGGERGRVGMGRLVCRPQVLMPTISPFAAHRTSLRLPHRAGRHLGV